MSRSVIHRMEDGLRLLRERWGDKRKPKAFYLSPDEWREFMATEPPTVESVWGNNPPQTLTEPAFKNIPVRDSTSLKCRLYDHTGTGREI